LRTLPILAAVFALAASTSLARAAGPDSLVPFNEQEHREVLAGKKGQVVLFNFWATWCAPCRVEMPHLVELAGKHGSKGFRLVTVSADEAEDKDAALNLLREHGVPGPAFIKSVADDDAFINAIHENWSGALPALFLYDREGKLAEMWVGETSTAVIQAAIEKLL